jgi:hypothetical protein
MEKNETPKQGHSGEFDFQTALPIQFDPDANRMTVRPRIDGRMAEEAALRFLDEAVDLRQPDDLLFDLIDQPAVTSSVLGAFVKYHQRGINVILLDPSENIIEVLAHTQLRQFFQVRRRSSN